jgi:hypothetical protein
MNWGMAEIVFKTGIKNLKSCMQIAFPTKEKGENF